MWRARLSHLIKGVAIRYDNSPHSIGSKQYIAKHFPVLQKLNPQVTFFYSSETPKVNDEPVDLTNGEFTNEPHLVVEYDTVQKAVSIKGMDAEQIDDAFKNLAMEGLTKTTPPVFNIYDIIHAYHPPLPPYRPNLGPGWQYTEM